MTVAQLDGKPETPFADETPSEESALVEYLRERDVACPLCGYNLRGLTAARCPECGRGLHLSVGLTEPRIGAWVTCLVGVTASAGLGLLATAAIVQNGWDVMYGGDASLAQRAAFTHFLASMPAAAAVIVLRRRYRRLPQAAQWTMAALAVAATAWALVQLATNA